MIVRLTTLETGELVRAEDVLRSAAALLRTIGRYSAAANVLAAQREIGMVLLQRATAERVEISRQLSLVPPTAYDPPA